jgi:hypothetical protein
MPLRGQPEDRKVLEVAGKLMSTGWQVIGKRLVRYFQGDDKEDVCKMPPRDQQDVAKKPESG